MLQPVLFATLAAVGNAIFVYGQRGAATSANPFLFMGFAVLACLAFFAVAVLVYRTPEDTAYVAANWRMILLSGFGFFVTFVGFFLLFNKYGASQYTLYAVISILTTSIGVGVFLYRESINAYQIAGTAFAVAAIILFAYGKAKSG
ncbi:EamA family transporter [Denitrobaculum tricleocarpae]|uniref:EamA family transporter n=1 Tax=Denitrobaculum tricleocarpae TaxID=2591009 RepID=A0A545TTD3_9PROT|nr:EamA family transporter [Denitrobaculum tricleocarpae]TQV80480.1 EamA family transporter [Denitrobaculum tricleocarpae]